MKKKHTLRASLLALVLALAVSPFARAQTALATGRAALAQQTPAALETAHQAFKTGLQATPNDAALNFFYAATLLAREAHTVSFKQQFTSLNATIINPSIYALEYSFPLGFAGIWQPPAGVSTDAHLTYLNSKATLLDEALACLDKITDGNFTVTLTSAETSLLSTKVDFADVCILRAGLRLAKAALHLANSYNLSGEYRKVYDLYAAGNLTPQAVLAAFPQLFNLSTTPAQRTDARTQILLAHAEWNKALAAINTKRPASAGSVLGPVGESNPTPFLFAFDSIAAAEEVGLQFNALVASLSAQATFPTIPSRYYALQGYKINLSTLVTSPSGLRYLAPTRFDRGFFRPSTWPDATLGGVFPEATQDNMNDAGNFLFLLQPTIYEPYQFWLLAGAPDEPGYFEDGEVRFREISGIAVDANGNIYVADQGNHLIRKISTDNKVTTIAGQKWSNSSERESLQRQYEGYPSYYPAILASNIGPIAVDGNGTVYFVNGRFISKVTAGGKLSNLAGSLPWSYQNAKDGLGANAVFAEIRAIATDKNGNLYVCDQDAIRKIAPNGQVTTIAGKLDDGIDDSHYGYVDGPGLAARFNSPSGIAVDDTGVIYVIDRDNLVIRKIQPNGTTSTFVGNAKISNHFDAKGTKARLNRPEGLAIDSSGNLYFADRGTIRKVKPDGTVTTIAGKLNPERGAFRLRGQMGIQEAAGEAAIFGQDDVTGLAVDRRGTLYASFENSIYEAESIAAPPSGTPFPTPTPFLTPTAKPSPAPSPSPAPTPQLLSLTLSTNTVDLSNGAVNLPFTAITSGTLRNLNLNFSHSLSSESINGYLYGVAIRSSGLFEIPAYAKAGLWTLSSVGYGNSSDDWTNLTTEQVAGLGNLTFTVSNPLIDNIAPIVHSITLLTSEANASTSSTKIRYRVQISDNLSGFSSLNLSFESADSPGFINSADLADWDSLVAVDGNLKTYEGTIHIHQGSPAGIWTLQSLYVSDKAGNGRAVNLTSELQAVNYIVSNSATNQTYPPLDQFSPNPTTLTLDKTAVNVSSADQKVKIRLTINNDDLPSSKPYIFIDLVEENGNGVPNSLSASNFELVSGTSANGIFEGELIIPRYSKNGNYTVWSVSIDDFNTMEDTGSYAVYGDSIPRKFRKTITVTGTQDVIAPALQSIAVSPTSADTRNGKVLVTANLTITDDLSGLQEADYSRAGALALRSPSGKEFLWSEFNSGDRISGNSTNGIYQVRFQLPQYSEEGAWTIDYIELIDRTYNTRFLIPANLTAQQIAASTIQVQGWPRVWEQQSFTSAASSKGNATIQLTDLNFTYNGTEKVPTVVTTPGNLSQNVTLTYNGATTPPIDPGTYTVVAFLNHPAYQGRQVETMTISKIAQTIGSFSAIGDKVFGAAPFEVTAPASSSNLPVTLRVKSGPATVSGNTVTLTGVGSVVLAANQAGNDNYSAASEVTTIFTVSNAPTPTPAVAPPSAPSGGGAPAQDQKPKKGGNSPSAKKSSGGSTKSSATKSSATKSGGGASKKPAGKTSSSGKKSAGKKAKKK